MSYIEKISQFKSSTNLALRLIYSALKPFTFIRRFFIDAHYRALVLTKWQSGKQYYQQQYYTKADRYPFVFATCSRYLASQPSPSLLSFGCSTGEEVATLGKYMPSARIMGVDINEWCIKQSIKNHSGVNFSFHHRISAAFIAATNFDAIFCMAVFQHTSNRAEGSNLVALDFTFQQFEAEIMMLDAKLKPGGLLIIDNTDFSFLDTAAADHYKPLDFENNKRNSSRPLFDRNNNRIADTQSSYRVFMKKLA
jgi:hypothetical protein